MSKTVISINSNKAMNFLLFSVLEKEYHLIDVADVYEATNELKKRLDIKAIIVDIDYEEKEVWEFIHHIKTSKFYYKPMMVLTSDKSRQMKEQIEEARIKYLFYKPFSPLEILKKLENV